jgi:NAD(P)-dependent dehydrogenase (short-subunit alcohol dehydrogenase family)
MTASSPFDLAGKAAIVTGASSGLGRHFARTLARAGAKVALAARRVDPLGELARQIEAFDERAIPIALDVTKSESVRACVETAETELGPISILVNNAGIARTAPSLEVSEADWDQVIDTNLKGAWLMAQETARHMAGLGHGGSIINVASILGLGAAGQLAAYCASKAALINLTRALAIDLARDGIRVNALAPGYIQTNINREYLTSTAGEALKKRIPQRRFGRPEDLDGVLLLLASEASRYMTGSVLVVDGGQSAAQ